MEIDKKINGVSASTTATQPLWLLAEITYQCPLQCAFCYNPTDFDKHTQNELDTESVSYTHLTLPTKRIV